ncbi:MAG: hypothetical protein GF398_02000 [Chitinivibrionales bacterium]|nr:hypothetical protein [Chitinivibrionales bacterium]
MPQSATFCTAVNCMDGRTQVQVNAYLKKYFTVEYVDTITEPGPVKILAEQSPHSLLDSILARLDISVHKHGSKGIGVVAHYDCAGNPCEKDAQMDQLSRAIAYLSVTYPDMDILGLWVGESWHVERV